MRRDAIIVLLGTLALVVMGATASKADSGSTASRRTPSRELTVERDGSIWLVALDGRKQRRLSPSPLNAHYATWAPDGRRLAFESYDGVFVVGADGSRLRKLVNHDYGYPAWSPDGRRILLSSDRGGDWDIYSVRPDGSGLRNLTPPDGGPRFDDGENRQFSWSPDGKRIAFFRGPGGWPRPHGPGEIWVMDADGSHQRNVTGTPKAGETTPKWSPDGRSIAFTASSRGHAAIHVINPDGTGRRQISPTSDFPGFEHVLRYEWFPDSRSIVLWRVRRRATYDVLTVTSDGRNAEATRHR